MSENWSEGQRAEREQKSKKETFGGKGPGRQILIIPSSPRGEGGGAGKEIIANICQSEGGAARKRGWPGNREVSSMTAKKGEKKEGRERRWKEETFLIPAEREKIQGAMWNAEAQSVRDYGCQKNVLGAHADGRGKRGDCQVRAQKKGRRRTRDKRIRRWPPKPTSRNSGRKKVWITKARKGISAEENERGGTASHDGKEKWTLTNGKDPALAYSLKVPGPSGEKLTLPKGVKISREGFRGQRGRKGVGPITQHGKERGTFKQGEWRVGGRLASVEKGPGIRSPQIFEKGKGAITSTSLISAGGEEKRTKIKGILGRGRRIREKKTIGP